MSKSPETDVLNKEQEFSEDVLKIVHVIARHAIAVDNPDVISSSSAYKELKDRTKKLILKYNLNVDKNLLGVL